MRDGLILNAAVTAAITDGHRTLRCDYALDATSDGAVIHREANRALRECWAQWEANGWRPKGWSTMRVPATA